MKQGINHCISVIGWMWILTSIVACTKQPAQVNQSPYLLYTLAKGTHYANNDSTTIVRTQYKKQVFDVIFDSSAVYKTAIPQNQLDVNKLYGFADNNAFHQEFSARFGWNWLNDGLHLWGYVYNNNIRQITDMGTFPLQSIIHCSIAVNGNQYVFTANNRQLNMNRLSTDEMAVGYKLFPYFGGDEPAPQHITIKIAEYPQ